MLELLPPSWRRDRMLLGDRSFWSTAQVRGNDDAVLLERVTDGSSSMLALGEPRRARELLARRESATPATWVTIPRLGAGPVGAHGAPDNEGEPHPVDDDLPRAVRRDLRIEPATAWDWFATTGVPEGDEPDVVRLDVESELAAIRECLAEANPGSRADPCAIGEAAWFGVRDGSRLLGVVGAALRAGDPTQADVSWHVHGLGVRHEARSRGFGSALTAAATRAALQAGADWASLGMYASNAVARRVYTRLGYVVEGRFTSYRAADGDEVA